MQLQASLSTLYLLLFIFVLTTLHSLSFWPPDEVDIKIMQILLLQFSRKKIFAFLAKFDKKLFVISKLIYKISEDS